MRTSNSHSCDKQSNTRQILWRGRADRDKYSDLVLTSSMSHMLIEDIHTGIIPFSYDRHGVKSQVRLANPSTSLEQMIIRALPTMYGSPYDLRDAVCGFIRYAAHVLATYGELICEVVYYYDDKQQGKAIGFELCHVPPGVVKRAFGIYYYRQREDDGAIDPTAGKPRRIDSSYIFHLKLPHGFGSPASYRRKLRRLAQVGQNIMPSFAIDDMRNDNANKVFDFSAYRRGYEQWVAKSTQYIGWMARGTFRESTTEYFCLLRHLRFRQNQAVLRAHILNELNAVLKRIEPRIGFNGTIEMHGLPNAEDYNRLIGDLQLGRLAFMNAWESN